MEAVLEKPVDQMPDFDEEAWAKKMGGAGIPDTKKEEESSSLSEALGQPDSFGDLWPGYCYKPPKLKDLETIIPLAEQMTTLFNEGKVLQAVDCAVQIVQSVAGKQESGKFREVTQDDIKEAFDEDEIANIIDHIMRRQGLKIEGAEGNAPGRWIGLRSFQTSAAFMEPTTLKNAESSPSPNSADSSEPSENDPMSTSSG